jgi:hypothetical protein
MGAKSRLRRWVVSDRWFSVTYRVLPRRPIFAGLVAPPGTCPDAVVRTALRVYGNLEWHGYGDQGSAGMKPGGANGVES